MALKFVIKQKMHANDIVNVYHYAETPGVNSGDAQAIVDEIADAYRDELTPAFCDAWQMVGVDFYDTDNLPGTPAVPYTPTGGFPVGVAGPDGSPNQIAVLVKWTCAGGPPHRGRTYLSGWTEGFMGSAGNIATAQVNQAQAFADRIREISLTGGNTAQMVIVSTGSNITPAGTEAVVINGQVNPFPKTQRRRAIGNGS
ncbi:MAG: hypothetical protein [Circular genetic element sp.]|nr:MAG: hypothetical protein [Circular genetic element sp.]